MPTRAERRSLFIRKPSMLTTFRSILSDEAGQGLAEYGLILGLIAVVCVGAVVFLSGKIQSILSTVGSGI
jgi:pilus assembly protein Flp/PilA